MRLPKPKSGYSVSPPPLVLRLTRRRLCSAQAASSSQSGSGVLGARGGKAIDNKAEVLRQVDVALGVSRPPDLEILLADHLTCTDSPKSIALHTALFRFGHAAVRYTTSDGQQRVMNILGSLDKPGSRMVNFVPPEEYLYGTAGERLATSPLAGTHTSPPKVHARPLGSCRWACSGVYG